jgi:hypothetical protein
MLKRRFRAPILPGSSMDALHAGRADAPTVEFDDTSHAGGYTRCVKLIAQRRSRRGDTHSRRTAVFVSGRVGHAPDRPRGSLGEILTKREDEQRVEHVERSKPIGVDLRICEQRLQKHEKKERHGKADYGPPNAADDRGGEHQDRNQVKDDEAPLPVRLQAFAAQDAKAGQEKLDNNCENEHPRKSDEDPARHMHRSSPHCSG